MLDLGTSSATPGPEIIRLIDPAKDTTTSYKYAALSYQWGGKEFIKLTAGSESSLRAGIPVDDLPLTFQEAISATRALCLRYLWIDALCIIQGCPDDWACEAPKMGLVYGKSHVNLAAAAATDPDGGLFAQRHPVLINGFVGTSPAGKEEYMCTFENDWETLVDCAPLNERGWVLQERVLAPRTLHFTSAKVFWECCESKASEKNRDVYAISSKVSFHQLQNGRTAELDPELAYSVWYEVLQSYRGMKFTVNGDRLMAISGIVEAVKRALPRDEEYHAGLWQSHLPWNLLWSIAGRGFRNESLVPLQERVKPSWSWASADPRDGVAWVANPKYSKSRAAKARVLKFEVEPISNPLGSVKNATLWIQARMCTVRIPMPSKDFNDGFEIKGRKVSDRSHYSFSHPLPSFDATLLLEIFTQTHEEINPELTDILAGLILCPTGEKGTYYRVGSYKVQHREDEYADMARQDAEALDRAFGECDLAPSQYQEFDGKEMYTVKII